MYQGTIRDIGLAKFEISPFWLLIKKVNRVYSFKFICKISKNKSHFCTVWIKQFVYCFFVQIKLKMLFDRANKYYFKQCALLSEQEAEDCVRRWCLKSVIIRDPRTETNFDGHRVRLEPLQHILFTLKKIPTDFF